MGFDQTPPNDSRPVDGLAPHSDRDFADRAVTLTVEGLFDRGVSHGHIAQALFDMALSLAAGDGSQDDDTANWLALLHYFHEQVQTHRQMVKAALAEDSG